MKKYTPEQEAVARNLALFKGETPQEYKPFETDIFKTSGENIAEKSEYYRSLVDQLGIDPKLFSENPEERQKFIDQQKVKAAQDYWKKRQAFGVGPYASKELNDYWIKKLQSEGIDIQSPTAYDYYQNMVNEYEKQVGAMGEEEATKRKFSIADERGLPDWAKNLGEQRSFGRVLSPKEMLQLYKNLFSGVEQQYMPKVQSLQDYLSQLYKK